ncbi:anti-sigma factor [Streptomyces sp. AC550_RSS872]|uniref:anti-sigma factor family protein n=1 Tax=Streptomyces sp. AC550_RSS872 TaxID=2823689 RepID=UPI001C2616CA|nr:zf-HC2 domain-containing protein [Streptomyces sp. AC550_RSS872]
MSGSRPNPAERLLAEQHLGDRLSALVDGELGHETRERVLAHLATCARCKSEVDAQRRLKNVFAEAAPPPPSESFLARLQELPGGGFGGLSGRPGASGAFGMKRGDRFEFGYVPSRSHGSALPATDSGFRTHPVGRQDADRSASSRMRFAFVAAGAVSLAAIALGGVTSSAPTDAEARGGSGGSNVTPARTQGTGAAATAENQRRRAVGPLLAQGQGTSDTPLAPTEVSAPLLPGMPAQPVDADLHTLTAPVVAGAAAMSPLIRSLSANPPLALTAWSTTPGITTTPDLFAAPVPDAISSPSTSPATGR